jgi:hypothetical protein
MSNAYFILFELIIYLNSHFAFATPETGIPNHRLLADLFGVTLELATIRQLQAYEYGQFLIMVLDVPLCIGIAWSCVIYSSMEFSEASSLPLDANLDGLLA